ncbi:MAG: LPS sulfotransferase NodH [Arenicella sp.]
MEQTNGSKKPLGEYSLFSFLVLASGRSGSTMLVNYLSSHPKIRCHHEPFRKRGWHPDLRAYDKALDALNHIQFQGLSTSTYHKTVSSLQSILRKSTGNTLVSPWKVLPEDSVEGFKITWAQADTMPSEFRQWLIQQKHLKVIVLSRVNSLARYVSYELAKRTGVWHSSSARNTLNQLYVDPRKFKVFCQQEVAQKSAIEALMSQTECELMRVNYEQLLATPDSTMKTIFEFLGSVSTAKLIQETQKLASSPIQDIITNYSELEQQGLV